MPKTVDEVKPTFEDIHGKAWEIDLEALRAQPKANPHDTAVKGYIVHAPWAHPHWFYYALFSISLADKEGVPPAQIRKPGATHELMVLALHPDHKPFVNRRSAFLHPANYCLQYIADNDETAGSILTGVVQDIINGSLSPDTDFRKVWHARFPQN